MVFKFDHHHNLLHDTENLSLENPFYVPEVPFFVQSFQFIKAAIQLLMGNGDKIVKYTDIHYCFYSICQMNYCCGKHLKLSKRIKFYNNNI